MAIDYNYRSTELRTIQGPTAVANVNVTVTDFSTSSVAGRPPFRMIKLDADGTVDILPEGHSEDADKVSMPFSGNEWHMIFGKKIYATSAKKTGIQVGW